MKFNFAVILMIQINLSNLVHSESNRWFIILLGLFLFVVTFILTKYLKNR
jgi:hypothetical protein